jgi:hypothetical protein
MKLVREITVGQLAGAIIFLIGFLATFYTLKADVDDMKKIDHEAFIRREEFDNLNRDVSDVRKDVLDILKILYVTENSRLAPGVGANGKSIDSHDFDRWYSHRRNADTTNSRGAGQTLRPGTDTTR